MRASVAAALLFVSFLLLQAEASAAEPLLLSCNEKPSIPGTCQPYAAIVGENVHRSVLLFIHFQYNFTLHSFDLNVTGVRAGQTASVLLTPHRRALYLNFTAGISSYMETWSVGDFCPATPDDITGCNIVPVTLDLTSGLNPPASNLTVCLADLTLGVSSCIDLQFPGVAGAASEGAPNYALAAGIIIGGALAEIVWLYFARRPR